MGCFSFARVLSKLRLRRSPKSHPKTMEISGPTDCHHNPDWSIPGLSEEHQFLLREKAIADAALRYPQPQHSTPAEMEQKDSLAVREEEATLL
ncbi:MAG: hypothetical protein M1832_005363 [Thelocarpon impressellum]|nr:MAG: hypothetical protein M1832_005363 [Thelocarpon impressellum]